MKRCGKTCFMPSMVAAHGRPQALAWNIGTIPHTQSSAERLITSVMQIETVCR